MYSVERNASITLATCPALAPSTLRKLVRGMGSAQAVLAATQEDWQRCCGIRPATVESLDKWRRSVKGAIVEAKLQQRGISCDVLGDEQYPSSLLDLEDPPVVLFRKGTASSATLRGTVAVVGTRRASSYGREACQWITRELGLNDIAVVSGLAMGIDATAHQTVLEVSGLTTAVLACGVDVCYPPVNTRLYQSISERGLLYSEYPPGTNVDKYRFPERNRLIAALAQIVVVIQAGERSGALRTVDSALELGRDVYVVPGPITSVHFRGSHKLIEDGANVLVDPKVLLEQFDVTSVSKSKMGVPAKWLPLYEALDEPQAADALARLLQLPPSHVYSGILQLELSGHIERLPGGLYRRVLSK